MPCPSDDELRSLSEGKLDPQLAATSQEHVAGCSDCSVRLFTLGPAPAEREEEKTAALAGMKPLSLFEAPIAAPLERGDTVGRYLVVNRLGAGGMGVVYAAYDPELDRKVAVKLLQVASGATEGMRANQALLLREAQAMAKLSHPNVIAVHDVGTLEGNRVFVAMELVEGPSLRGWLDERPRDWREVLHVFRQAGAGLAAAHDAGLVHRDFKPDNVLVGKDGRTRVLDFGLARASEGIAHEPIDLPAVRGASGSGPLSTPITEAGRVMGTPPYMAPEQFRGKSAGARTDQFSFGVTLHEALYGVRPYKGRYADRPEGAKWALQEPPRGNKVPAWLRKILLRCLSEDPEARFPSMDALLVELGRDPAAARRRALALGGVALLVLAVGFSVRALNRHDAQLCRGADRRLAGIWDGPRRDAIRAAFLATQLPAAADAWTRAEATLEAYAQSWVAMRTDACEATRVRGEQSDEVMERRMSCLDRRLGEVQALGDLFAHPDKDVVAKAVQASHALTPLTGCADLAALTARIPLPEPKSREQVDSLRRQLSHGKELFDSGKVKEAADQSEEVVTRARTLGYRPLVGEALLQLGTIRASKSDPHAPDLLLDAAWTAQGSHDDETAAIAASSLLRLTSNQFQFEAAGHWFGLAESLLARLDHPDRLEPLFLIAQATYQTRLGHPEQAAESDRKAIAIQLKSSTDELAMATTWNSLGSALSAEGDQKGSLEAYAHALSIRERVLGRKHPDTTITLMNIGVTELSSGLYAASAEHLAGARDLFLEVSGADAFLYGLAACNLSEALAALGRYDEGRRNVQLAYELWARTQGDDSDAVNMARDDLSAIALLEGDWGTALTQAQRALALRSKSEPPDHPEIGKSLMQLARAELATGKKDDALSLLERAEKIMESHKVDVVDAAETRFALAEALIASGKDRPRAIELAQKSEQEFASIHRDERSKAVNDWLARTDPAPGARH